jgi:hypothetical protein
MQRRLIGRWGEKAYMKRDKYLAILFFLVFSFSGAYLLYDSLNSAGQYAEEGVLVGALFAAAALAAISWGIRQHLQSKALRRHLRRHS